MVEPSQDSTLSDIGRVLSCVIGGKVPVTLHEILQGHRVRLGLGSDITDRELSDILREERREVIAVAFREYVLAGKDPELWKTSEERKKAKLAAKRMRDEQYQNNVRGVVAGPARLPRVY